MSPITHFFVGWTALEKARVADRDKALAVLAVLAPDLDDIGIIVELVTRTLSLAETNYYQREYVRAGQEKDRHFAIKLGPLACRLWM